MFFFFWTKKSCILSLSLLPFDDHLFFIHDHPVFLRNSTAGDLFFCLVNAHFFPLFLLSCFLGTKDFFKAFCFCFSFLIGYLFGTTNQWSGLRGNKWSFLYLLSLDSTAITIIFYFFFFFTVWTTKLAVLHAPYCAVHRKKNNIMIQKKKDM